MPPPPQLTLIAGPNGAGKSTFTRTLAVGDGLTVLDPDAVARDLDPEAPERAAVAAGRVVIKRRNALFAARTSFVIETTLAGLTTRRHIEAARTAGFAVHLVYICASPIDVCIRRVAQRVAMGGHAVPEEDIRRRYERSLSNLPAVVRMADASRLFENSGLGNATLVAEIADGQVLYRAPVLPAWLLGSLGSLFSASPPIE